jgi:hypothetical protein
MRRALHLCCVLAAGLPAAGQVVIDRVIASAGLTVITLGDVRRELRFDAYFRNAAYQETPELRRQAAERLVNQGLLRREIEITRYIAPPATNVDARLSQMQRDAGLSADEFKAALAARGINEDELRQQLLWASTVFSFTEFRFGTGVQVPDQEVEQYYQEKYGSVREAPPLGQVRETITRILASQKTSQALDEWLTSMRTQLKVRIFQEALE